MKKKETLIVQFKYRHPGKPMSANELPNFYHVNRDLMLTDVFVTENGTVQREGKVYQYQVLRCYFRDRRSII